MQDYLFSMGISVILESIKKPELKRKYRNVFLKVFRVIKNAFPNDKDFE